MTAGEVFMVVVRWAHLVSAAAWVGGSLFYLLVLRPAGKRASGTPSGLMAAVSSEFRTLVNACIIVLVASGVILALDRLTVGVDAAYTVTLGVKSALSVWMFLMVHAERRRARVLELYRETGRPPQTRLHVIGQAVTGYNAVIIVGLIVFFLSDLLKVLFEIAS